MAFLQIAARLHRISGVSPGVSQVIIARDYGERSPLPSPATYRDLYSLFIALYTHVSGDPITLAPPRPFFVSPASPAGAAAPLPSPPPSARFAIDA